MKTETVNNIILTTISITVCQYCSAKVSKKKQA